MPITIEQPVTDVAVVVRHADGDGAPSYETVYVKVESRQRIILARSVDADGAPTYEIAELQVADSAASAADPVRYVYRGGVLVPVWRYVGMPDLGGPATPTLDTAVAWWTPADIAGSALVDQVGSVDLAFGGSPAATNDGTHRLVQFRRATSDYAAAGSTSALDVTSGNFTAVIVARLASDATDNMTFLSKRSGAGTAGYQLRFDTAGNDIEGVIQGTTAVVPQYTGPATITTASKHTHALRRNGSETNVIVDGTPGTPATSSQNLSNAVAFNLAREAGGTNYIDMDFYGTAFFSSALSDADTAAVGAELLSVGAL